MAAAHPSLSGQEIFEMARKIVGAEMQVITYNEFLPILLGPDSVGSYDGYDPAVDASIANEFPTAAYRVGHTMLSPDLLMVDENGNERTLSLADAFFALSRVTDEGISGLLRGLATQLAQQVDTQLVDPVRNMLFGPPGSPGRDLAALNIQRSRDHGLASYNTARQVWPNGEIEAMTSARLISASASGPRPSDASSPSGADSSNTSVPATNRRERIGAIEAGDRETSPLQPTDQPTGEVPIGPEDGSARCGRRLR